MRAAVRPAGHSVSVIVKRLSRAQALGLMGAALLVLPSCVAEEAAVECRPPLAAWTRAAPPAPGACAAEGVRFCGGDCGPCDDASCIVPRAPDGQVADVAVCFRDLADRGERVCSACGDGEACLYRSPRQLVCVPDAVCQALAARGAAHLCRFSDKSAYDAERPIASTSADCPHPSLCGGCCGDCELGGACVGRSPTRPFGVCADREGERPFWRQSCAVLRHRDGDLQEYPVIANCAVFTGPEIDPEVALLNGLSVPNCDEVVSAGYPVECY